MEQSVKGWLEHTIIGAMYMLAMVFIAFRLMGVHDPASLGPGLQSYSAYIIPAFLAASYLIGTTVSLLIPSLSGLIPEGGRRLVRGERYQALVGDVGHHRYVRFLNRGSVDLIREVDSLRRGMRLFQSLLLAVPILAGGFAIWGMRSPIAVLVPPALSIAACGVGLIFMAQRVLYQTYYSVAVAVRDELTQSSPGEGQGPPGPSTPPARPDAGQDEGAQIAGPS